MVNLIEQARNSLGVLMVGGFVGSSFNCPSDHPIDGRWDSNLISVTDLIGSGSFGREYTLRHLIEQDPGLYVRDVCEKNFSGRPSLDSEVFIGLFLKNTNPFDTSYLLIRQLLGLSSEDQKKYTENIGETLRFNGLGITEMKTALGLYCLYRAQELSILNVVGPTLYSPPRNT